MSREKVIIVGISMKKKDVILSKMYKERTDTHWYNRIQAFLSEPEKEVERNN